MKVLCPQVVLHGLGCGLAPAVVGLGGPLLSRCSLQLWCNEGALQTGCKPRGTLAARLVWDAVGLLAGSF